MQIAVFRENQYLPTLHSLFGRAANPGDIRIGACLQYDWEADRSCFDLEYPAKQQIEEIRVDACDSLGLGWARQQTQSLYSGEKFTLQIDGHMRFVRDWDVRLLQMWKSLRNKKAIVSHYAPNFEPSGGRVRDSFAGMGAYQWKKGTLWFCHAPIHSVASPPARPQPGAFISGHFLFGSAQIIKDVPYDPWLQRHGEESSMAVRLWTNGYDIYAPNEVIMWHQASTKGRPLEGDVIAAAAEREDLSALRSQALLNGWEVNDSAALVDLDKYGLGNVRTLEEYEKWSGIDFKNQVISDRARQGLFKTFKRKSAN